MQKGGKYMLKDKIAISSGAASCIGLEIAKVFLNEGAKVVFNDINQEALNHAVESFKANGFDCMGFTADVSNEKDVEALVDETVKQYGQIDILINNAGLQN